MTQLPTNRTSANSVQEHVDDHNTLAAEHNQLDGHAVATTTVHGIADTSTLVLTGDARLSDTRTPTDGSVTNAKVAANAAIVESKLSLASDAAAGTASRRTLGTGAAQAAAGDHAHSGTYIANSLVTTKGDLIAATANATPARVGAGTDGFVLTADAASTPGLKWAAVTVTPDPGTAVFDRMNFR